jgi:uncharacterized protein
MSTPLSQSEHVIVVTGTGSAGLPPDHATLQLGIRAQAAKAQAAMQACAKAMQAILATVKGAGVEERHIRTGVLTLTPEYRGMPDGSSKRAGNTATNMVYVTVMELDRLGTLLDAVVVAGGDDVVIQSINLEASNPLQALDLARVAALQDARRQAEHIASEMHLALGVPLRIVAQDGMARPQPRGMHFGGFMRAAKATTPVEEGELEVTASFEVTYAIVE